MLVYPKEVRYWLEYIYVIVLCVQGSLTIEGLAALLNKDKDQILVDTPLKNLQRVVFIDSTWSQSYGIRTVRILQKN